MLEAASLVAAAVPLFREKLLFLLFSAESERIVTDVAVAVAF